MKVGFTCSTFDLFHAGHVAMLREAKTVCDYLIVGIQTDPTIDRPHTKNKPVQSIIERQIQVASCRYVDETIVYSTEAELLTILNTLPIDVRIIGEEYQDKTFTGHELIYGVGLWDNSNRLVHSAKRTAKQPHSVWFNRRRHNFSTTDLRERVVKAHKKEE